MALVQPHPDLLEATARKLVIKNYKHENATKPWEPNTEQRLAWEIGHERPRVYILKDRQVGISTSEDLKDLLFTSLNSKMGNAVNTWLVWDEHANAMEQLEKIEDFRRQLRLPGRMVGNSIMIPVAGRDNFSKIMAYNAYNERTGASKTCERMHLSELPKWRRGAETFTSLNGALFDGGFGVIETTMLLGQDLPRFLWYEKNDWTKIFLSVEMHEEYRRDPSEFDPDHAEVGLEKLTKMGFTNIATMAYIQWALKNKCGGDIYALGREYPASPEMAFQSAKGRWVKITPKVAPHVDHQLPETDDFVKIYRMPEECFRSYEDDRNHDDLRARFIIGVDTAGDKNRGDSSVVALVDKRDMSLVAWWKRRDATTDTIARIGKMLQIMYTSPVRKDPYTLRNVGGVVPICVIERNGVGIGTCERARHHGLTHTEYNAKDGTTYEMLLAARHAIEAEAIFGPEELAKECDGLAFVDNKWHGEKDGLVSVGLCCRWAAKSPWVPTPPPKPIDVHVASKRPRRR